MSIESLMPVDYVILVVIALSAISGLWRGFIKEAFSLMTWVAAIGLAITFREIPAQFLEPMVGNQMVSVALGALIIFVLTMLVGGTLAKLLKNIIQKSNLGFLNRILGVIFGIARALIIIVALSIMTNFFLSIFNKNLDDFAWWNASELTPYVEQFENKAFDRLMKQYQERQQNSKGAPAGNTPEDKNQTPANGNLETNSEVKKTILKSLLDAASE